MGCAVIRARVLAVLTVVLIGLGALGTLEPAHAATNPTITSVTPNSGVNTGGTLITIVGTGFQPGALVFVGGAPATGVSVVNSTQLTAVTSRGTTGSAGVLVTNPDGGAQTLAGAFFYTEPASALSVASLSVTSGSVRGGTQLTINGSGFSSSTVMFGSTPAVSATTLGASGINVRTPPGLPGPVSVTVRNGDGTTSTLANAFTYDAGGLEVNGVTPGGALTAGGTAVRISGYGFAPGSTVSFGGVAATSVVVVNPTLITAVAPAGATGTVGISVSTPSGSSASQPNAFSYRSAAAASGFVLTSVSPANGPAVGGTQVNITGTGFLGGASVLFAGIPATDITSPGSSTIIARTPPNVAGPVPVTVLNSDGSSVTLNNGFTYEGSSGFAITRVTPSTGAASGGTVLMIEGSRFVSGAMVTVGGVNASNVWVVGDSQVYATTPAGASGPATVTVTNPGGLSASLAYSFTYGAGGTTPPPTLTPTVPPSSGTSIGFPLPAKGFGLVVFGGGTNAQLVAASTCTSGSLAFWSTNSGGDFDVYVPGASIGAVNAAWNARYANGIPASTPLIGRCQS